MTLKEIKNKGFWPPEHLVHGHPDDIYRASFVASNCIGKTLFVGVEWGGLILETLKKQLVSEINGVDTNKEKVATVATCFEKFNDRVKIAFVNTYATLPFVDEEFDTVVLSDILPYVDDEKLLLKEAFRICAKMGQVLITVPFGKKILLRGELKVKEPLSQDKFILMLQEAGGKSLLLDKVEGKAYSWLGINVRKEILGPPTSFTRKMMSSDND